MLTFQLLVGYLPYNVPDTEDMDDYYEKVITEAVNYRVPMTLEGQSAPENPEQGLKTDNMYSKGFHTVTSLRGSQI